MLDEEYQIGDVFIEKETGTRYVCVDLNLCQDTYFDTVYVISEKEYLECKSLTLLEDDLETFMCIEGCEIDGYEWVRNTKYRPCIQTAYCLAVYGE